MKKITTAIILVLALLSITSCKKYLDVKPKQTIGENLVITSLDGLSKGVTGAFSQMQSSNLYGGGIISNSEFMADYIVTSQISDYSLVQFVTHQLNAYNSQPTGMWNDAYHAILICNTVLKYLPNFESQDPAQVGKLRGECYFVRGIMMYELVRIFSQPSGYTADDSHLGIPIVLLPGTAYDQQTNARASVAQVYAQVISDLQQAEQLLPADKTARASKYAAQAFLAKVYFSQSKYTDAKTYADKIVNDGYTLNDSVNAIYNDFASNTSSEAIFQIINEANDIDNGALYGRFSTTPFGQTVPSFRMNTPLVTMVQTAQATGDRRAALLFKRGVGGVYLCRKYINPNMNVTVIRYAEILLMRAECEAQAGNEQDALSDLNLIRARAGVFPQSASGPALLTAIRSERILELAMEGDRFYEGKRQKVTFQCVNTSGISWNDNSMVYPIPQQEVDQNKAMVQNPGY